MIVYFAHPIKSYASPDERYIIEAIKDRWKDCSVINPANVSLVKDFKSCKKCMEDHMRAVFFPLLASADIFVIWDPVNSCGIECELHEAWRLGKECYHVDYNPQDIDFVPINLQEYHYSETVDGVE